MSSLDECLSLSLFDFLSERVDSFSDPMFISSLEIFIQSVLVNVKSQNSDFHQVSDVLSKLGAFKNVYSSL